MIGFLTILLVISLASAQDWETMCPQVEYPPLPEAVFMTQVVLECPNNLYGKVFYTCYNGRWNLMEECRCKSEVDEFGYRWWGVKVNKTEIVETPGGVLKRFCKASGWGNYDGSSATKCKGFTDKEGNVYPDTERGSSIDMCKGEGTRNVFCDYSGKWVYTEGECYCPSADGWDRVLEGLNQTRACGSNTEVRYCERFGVWGDIDSSECYCPPVENFLPVRYGETNIDNKCDNGVEVYRTCSATGEWESVRYNSAKGVCKCTEEPGWSEGVVGDELTHVCSHGSVKVRCNEVGRWKLMVDDCSCAAEGVWDEAALGSTAELICQNGGRLRRTCKEDGWWEAEQDFNCRCPAEGIWDETAPGQYARAGCGSGFVLRLCGLDGHWTETYDRSKCYCNPQNGWQLTMSGAVAMKACPSGEQTRQCSEWGEWGEVDYSNCRCEAVDGFEATRVDSYATAFCLDADGVPDEEHTQTRYCDAEGRWGDVDQSQCPVKWCPTVDSWYKVPVGHTPTIVRLGCMSGERWRQCNLNGVWGPVNTDNCDCVYSPTEGAEELLHPGDSYALACSVGERVFKCNEESGYFDPVDLTSCFCESDRRFPTTHAGDMASASCESGTATRFCTQDGFWEEVDNSLCTCPESGVWPKSEVDTKHSVLCDAGFRSRDCNARGYWTTAEESTCKCVDKFEAHLGETVSEACEEGEIRHVCSTGHFDAPDRSTCFCASRVEYGMIWNRLAAGELSPEVTCMNGERVARACGLDTGRWEALDPEVCRCSAEDGWTEAGVGEYSYGICTGHSLGVSRRMCYGTHWGPVDESTCIQDCRYDGGDGEIQYVPIGERLNVTCYVNLDGARSYVCRVNEETGESELVLEADTCARLSCESDMEPIYVDVGNSETRPCIEGFTGTRTRTCLQGGVWSDYDLTGCSPILCKPTKRGDLSFSFTLAGVMAEAECAAGYSGAMKLFCNITGMWEGEVIDDCHQNFCPAEGDWPSIPALSSHTGACPAEYTGTWTRACLADGTWEELAIPESCVPVPPTMKTMPYEGMTHVSRMPSVSLFTSIAIRDLEDDCPVTIVSVENPEEVYTLAVNDTKTLMKGRYNNGGVFADFVLEEGADVYDVSNYLRYGEYKAVFQPCWHALNNAVVPTAQLEVKFHTTAIPPSPPTHIALQYLSNTFQVTFEPPQFVDEPFPVTSYFLSFQPPVLPSVSVPASARTFGPFPYVPGHVTLLVRAENIYGLSSPDIEVPYDFDDILLDAAAHVRLDIDAPTVSLLRQVKTQSGVDVTVAVGTTDAMAPFAAYFDVVCNGETLPKIASLYATEFTVSTTQSEVTVACHLALGSSQGAVASETFAVVAADAKYATLALSAEEETALRVRLSWAQPALYTAEPIKAYAVQCKRQGGEFAKTQYTTSESIVVDASAFAPGPMTCRAAAVSSMEASVEGLPWSEATVEALHVVDPEEVTVTSEVKGTEAVVRVEASYCMDVRCIVSQGKTLVQEVTQTCEGSTAVVALRGLELSTAYSLTLSSEAVGFVRPMSITTAAEQENAVELTEAGLFAHSAVLEVALSTPDRVYCAAHTEPVHAEVLLEKLQGGVLSDLLVPLAPAAPTTRTMVVLTDLSALTSYSVTCVTALSHTVVTRAHFFTTIAEEAPLTVVAVTASGDSRDLTLDLLFDSRVNVEAGAAMAVTCGGRREALAMVASEETQPYPYAVRVQLFPATAEGFRAGATCSLRFASLGAVTRADSPKYSSPQLLSSAPFPGGKAEYSFTISTDGMAPVLKPVMNSVAFYNVAALATTTETLTIPARFAYTVQCSRLGVPTVTHEFTEANGHIVQTGAQLIFTTGFLPDLHDCQLVIARHVLKDTKGNHAECSGSEDTCVLAFTARSTDKDIVLVKMSPADGAEFVATNQPVVFEFDREVVAQKEVVLRCLECEEPVLRLAASCAGVKCVVENEKGWEADRTYYITYDSTTFKAAWESYFYQPSMHYASFSTAANLCNMDYITEDWDSDCSCVNTGTHCQCNCGLTAVLKAF